MLQYYEVFYAAISVSDYFLERRKRMQIPDYSFVLQSCNAAAGAERRERNELNERSPQMCLVSQRLRINAGTAAWPLWDP